MHICCFLFFFLEDSEDSLACFRRIAHPRIAHPSESINSGRDSELLLTSSGQGYLTSLGRTNLLLLLSILLSFLLLFHLSLLLSLLFSSASKEWQFASPMTVCITILKASWGSKVSSIETHTKTKYIYIYIKTR